MKRLSARKDSLLGLALILLVATAGVISLAGQFEEMRDRPALQDNDFAQDYESARAWRAGRSPYEPQTTLGRRYENAVPVEARDTVVRNPHLPVQIVVVGPLAALEPDRARTIWFLLDGVALMAGIVMLMRSLGASWLMAFSVGLGAFMVPVVRHEMRWLQWNGILLVCVVGAWRALRDQRERRSGVLLGIAIALKVFPILLVIPLVRSRASTAAVWAVGWAAGLTFISFVMLGGDAVMDFLHTSSNNFSFWRSAPWNISAVAIPFRWLTESVWRPEALSLPVLAASLGALAGVACVVAASRTTARKTSDVFIATLPWMLLASPLAWSHYLVLGLPFLGLYLKGLGDKQVRTNPLILLAAALLLVGELRVYAWLSPWTQIAGFALPTYALIILGVSDFRKPRSDVGQPDGFQLLESEPLAATKRR